MKSLKIFATLLFLAGSLLASPVHACPLCAEAVSSSNSDDEDSNDFPAAMNQSIYLMVSVPYLALGFGGFLVYRGCKKNAAQLQGPTNPSAPSSSNG